MKVNRFKLIIPRRSKNLRVNQRGFTHHFILPVVVVLFAVVGTYLLVKSHAAPTPNNFATCDNNYHEIPNDGNARSPFTAVGTLVGFNGSGVWKNQYVVVVTGTDDRIYYTQLNVANGFWTGNYIQVPNDGKTTSLPSIQARGDDFEITVKGIDGLKYATRAKSDGSWVGWHSVPGAYDTYYGTANTTYLWDNVDYTIRVDNGYDVPGLTGQHLYFKCNGVRRQTTAPPTTQPTNPTTMPQPTQTTGPNVPGPNQVSCATSPPASSHPTLRLGSRGDDVKHLQYHFICEIGGTYGDLIKSSGGIDGAFGSKTWEAVKRFQNDQHVPNSSCKSDFSNYQTCDGIVGAQTWGAIHAFIERQSH